MQIKDYLKKEQGTLTHTPLKMTEVYDSFHDYNFLIFTTSGTVDTSSYDKIIKKSESILGETFDVFKLIKLKPVSAKIKSGSAGFGTPDLDGNTINSTTNYKIEKMVILVDNKMGSTAIDTHFRLGIETVKRIQIKSRRNFLKNQTPDKYVQNDLN